MARASRTSHEQEQSCPSSTLAEPTVIDALAAHLQEHLAPRELAHLALVCTAWRDAFAKRARNARHRDWLHAKALCARSPDICRPLRSSARAVDELMCDSPKSASWTLFACHCGDEGAEALSLALSSNRSALELNLFHNMICDHGCVALSRGLDGHPRLQRLCLGRNHVSDLGARALAALLKKGGPLRLLNLGRTHL